jgi:hypothetical protein
VDTAKTTGGARTNVRQPVRERCQNAANRVPAATGLTRPDRIDGAVAARYNRHEFGKAPNRLAGKDEAGRSVAEKLMQMEGTVHNGVVILDNDQQLPNGTRVQIVVDELPAGEAKESSLAGLLKLAGTVDGLPPDLAWNHDHYIHGTPKR